MGSVLRPAARGVEEGFSQQRHEKWSCDAWAHSLVLGFQKEILSDLGLISGKVRNEVLRDGHNRQQFETVGGHGGATYLTGTNARCRTSSPMLLVSARLTFVTQAHVVPRAGC